MMVEQMQHLLCYLGYDTGGCDGISGPKTQKAMEDFRKEYPLTLPGQEILEMTLIMAVGEGWTRPKSIIDGFVPESGPVETGTFWDEIQYFTREEFRCQCGGKYCNGFPVEPQENMVRTVNEIRRRLGVPAEIVSAGGSGVRCTRHNANVGGVANSNHLYGKAADLHSKKSPQEMARVAEAVMGSTGEIGIYSWGIHVATDCDYSRFYG